MAKSNKVLKIGDRAKLYGAEIELKGLISYRQRDDGEYYYWHDWYAEDKDGHQYWIDYDEYSKQYTFFKRIEFNQNRVSIESIRDAAGDQQIHYVEKGNAKIIEVVGEMPFAAKKGQMIEFIDAVGGRGLYSIENDGKTPRLYLGENIDEANLLEAFGHVQAAAKLRNRRRQAIRWRVVDIVVATCAAIVLMLLGVALGSKTPVYEEVVDGCLENDYCLTSRNLTAPIEFEAWPGLYVVEAASNLPLPPIRNEYWRQLVVEFIGDDRNPTNGVLLENWSEYWVDGSESGRDSKLEDGSAIKSSQTDEYELRVLYRENVGGALNFTNNTPVRIRVSRIYMTSEPLFFTLGAAAVYGVFRIYKINKAKS